MPLITNEPDLLAWLDAQLIPYVRNTHPPVYTCAEAAQHRPSLPGVETKNLFLRDESHHFYLVMTACEKRLDLKALGRAIGAAKLHFGSEEQLLEVLGLTPGSVTVLGLVNDLAHRVTLLMDADYWPAEAYFCHPLVNTATLVVEHQALVHFLEQTGHTPQVVVVPAH